MSSDLSRFKVRFTVEDSGSVDGELVRFQAPKTVEALLKILPVEGRASIWKEEVYFSVPLKLGLEKPVSKVEVGAIAYWPLGSAVCIFYGSSQPYSPVSLIGRVTSNLDLLRNVGSGRKIILDRI